MSKFRNLFVGLTAAAVSGCILLSAAEVAVPDSAAVGFGSGNIYEYEVRSNRHTQYVDATGAVAFFTTDGYEEKLSNDILSLYYSSEEESIRVLDKRTGYIWGCADEENNSDLNNKWEARANSVCYISYFDRKD